MRCNDGQVPLEFLTASSKAVFSSMQAADPEAVWLMQGWLFMNGTDKHVVRPSQRFVSECYFEWREYSHSASCGGVRRSILGRAATQRIPQCTSPRFVQFGTLSQWFRFSLRILDVG